jgi:dUTP pyrophosphatase
MRLISHKRLAYQTTLSAGVDVSASEDVVIKAGKTAIVPTGVKLAPESGDEFIEIQVRMRSSLAAKHGLMLANGVGTIDMDYSDDIGVIVYNSSDTDYLVTEGERVAQLVLSPVSRFEGVEIKSVTRTGGYGSTNTND